MIGPHFFDQADGAVLDRVELDGIEREQIFLIFGSVFHQVNVVGGTGAELLCKSGADPEHKAAVRHRQVVHHQMMRHAGRNQKKIAGRRCVEHPVDFQGDRPFEKEIELIMGMRMFFYAGYIDGAVIV